MARNSISRYRILFVLFLGFLLASCCKKMTPASGEAGDRQPATGHPAKLIPATVIDSRHLDGCTFLLQVKDGPVLEPEFLEEKYRHDGRKVLIRYHPVDRMSICMAGQPVVIDYIEFSEVR